MSEVLNVTRIDEVFVETSANSNWFSTWPVAPLWPNNINDSSQVFWHSQCASWFPKMLDSRQFSWWLTKLPVYFHIRISQEEVFTSIPVYPTSLQESDVIHRCLSNVVPNFTYVSLTKENGNLFSARPCHSITWPFNFPSSILVYTKTRVRSDLQRHLCRSLVLFLKTLDGPWEVDHWHVIIGLEYSCALSCLLHAQINARVVYAARSPWHEWLICCYHASLSQTFCANSIFLGLRNVPKLVFMSTECSSYIVRDLRGYHASSCRFIPVWNCRITSSFWGRI